MACLQRTKFEDLCSEVHISIFDYLNLNEIVESFFNLNQYFKTLLCNHHLLLHCSLIDEQNYVDFLLSTISLQQMKSLKCYDYHLIQFQDPNQFSCLHTLVVFKYATNIHEETIIDFILAIPQLKYCQVRMSQSRGRVTLSVPDYRTNAEQLPSSLEGLDIDSKSGLSFFYFCSHVLPRLFALRYLKVFLSCYNGIQKTIYEKPIGQLICLSKINLKIRRGSLEHLYLLAQCTPNLEDLQLDYSPAFGDPSYINAQNWFQLLSAWTNLKILKIYAEAKMNIDPAQSSTIEQPFQSIPFLVERHICPLIDLTLNARTQRKVSFAVHYPNH